MGSSTRRRRLLGRSQTAPSSRDRQDVRRSHSNSRAPPKLPSTRRTREMGHPHDRDTQSILDTNAAFYSAFSTLDLTTMEDLWLPDNTSICIFPNSKPLVGYTTILNSWKHAVKSMNKNSMRNWMAPDAVKFEYQGMNKATVVCDELIFFSSDRTVRGHVFRQTDVVNKFRARNMFKKVGSKWYMCYHEAHMERERRGVDNLGLSESMSDDSKETFLTMMTTPTRDTGWRNDTTVLDFMNWSCNPFRCG